MCFDPDSEPPIAPGPGHARSERVILEASDGNRLAALRADADDPAGACMIVLPDYYGLGPYYERLARRLAEYGIDAIAIDYYGRTAGTSRRDGSFDHTAHAGRTTWAGLRADAMAAASYIRSERGLTSLFSMGFCFGGRTSFLLGTMPELAMAGVIGFYGWPVGAFKNDTPAPADVAADIGAPLLGIFGGSDEKIPPADVATFETALGSARVDHRLVIYEGAPHSFFDRAHGDHRHASEEAWREITAFISAHSP